MRMLKINSEEYVAVNAIKAAYVCKRPGYWAVTVFVENSVCFDYDNAYFDYAEKDKAIAKLNELIAIIESYD